MKGLPDSQNLSHLSASDSLLALPRSAHPHAPTVDDTTQCDCLDLLPSYNIVIMPTVVLPEETPDNQPQRQNNGAVVTRDETSSSRPKRSCTRYQNRNDGGLVGTPDAEVNQLFSPCASSMSNDVAAAADALVGLSGAQDGSGDQDFSGEKSLNKDVASSAGTKNRKSKRIQERQSKGNRNNKKKKTGGDENENENENEGEDENEDNKVKGKKREEQVKLGGWRVYHPGISNENEGLRKKRGIYIILFPDGTVKIGSIYSDDVTKHIFGKRIRGIVVYFKSPVVRYRFLDTGSVLSSDGVKAVATMGQFALFVQKTPDGKSLYAGAAEQFHATQEMCDVLLEKLKHYAITSEFEMKLGLRNVAVKAEFVERKTHPKWIHFHYKFFGKKHHRDDCRWRGDVGDDEDWDRSNRYWNDWCDFARGFDKRCTCMENTH